jgi:hypothetical protein
VDVKLGSFRLASQLAEPLDQLFLELMSDVVLLAEKDDTAT